MHIYFTVCVFGGMLIGAIMSALIFVHFNSISDKIVDEIQKEIDKS